MAKNLSNEEDVEASQQATERSGNFMKLSEPTNFVVVVDADYEDGFFHFIKGKGSIACKAGIDGRGYAPDDCPICQQVMELYEESNELNEGKNGAVKKRANDLRASYQMFLAAIKGDIITTKNSKGKKVRKPDFEDIEAVQVLALTESQKKILLGLIDDLEFDKIENGDDLVGDDLPDLEKLVEVPDDYDGKVEELQEGDVEEEGDEDDADEEGEDAEEDDDGDEDDEVELPVKSSKSNKNKKNKRRKR